MIRHVPVWCFHGALDNVVPPVLSEQIVAAVKKYNPAVKFTLYPDANHDSWTATYNNDSFYTWLLAQSKYHPVAKPATAAELAPFAGRYVNGADTVILAVNDGRLRGYSNPARDFEFELLMSAPNQFFIREDEKAELLFSIDKKGKAQDFEFWEATSGFVSVVYLQAVDKQHQSIKHVSMAVAKIIWVDDEIESLQSQKLFLENKGYEVNTFTNGFDAIDYVKEHPVDVVLIDESMPGITGLETLAKIKEINQSLPVVLITKNETENLMDEAIGSQISDYLIKPVNPNQVWLSLKKIIDNKRLVAEKTTTAYQQQFRNLFMALNSNPDYNEWMDIYRKLVYWELEMQKSDSPEMQEVLQSQKGRPIQSFSNSFPVIIPNGWGQRVRRDL